MTGHSAVATNDTIHLNMMNFKNQRVASRLTWFIYERNIPQYLRLHNLLAFNLFRVLGEVDSFGWLPRHPNQHRGPVPVK